MWTKLYLALLAIVGCTTLFLIYYAWSWLHSIGAPAAALDGYAYNAGLAWFVTWIGFAALLAAGNAVLWEKRSAWAVWTAFIFFAIAILLRYLLLDPAADEAQRAAGLPVGRFSFSPLFAAVFVLGGAALTLADHLVALKVRDRAYPPPVSNVQIETDLPVTGEKDL